MFNTEELAKLTSKWLTENGIIDKQGRVKLGIWEGKRWVHVPDELKFKKETNHNVRVCKNCYSQHLKSYGYIYITFKCLECDEKIKTKHMRELELDEFYEWCREWIEDRIDNIQFNNYIANMTKQDFAKLLVKGYEGSRRPCCNRNCCNIL